jgi:hypothetical protein
MDEVESSEADALLAFHLAVATPRLIGIPDVPGKV